MKELEFDTKISKHVLLLPGLLASAYSLFPLVRYTRCNQNTYAITAIPLGRSISDFDSIVLHAVHTINKNILQKSQPKTIILFGHSHGGRIAFELVRRLKSISPTTEYSVITAGTPMTKELDHVSWLRKKFYSISKAYRDWPMVPQPDSRIVKRYIGYYSTDDKIVIPECAKAGHTGELIELQGFSHHDLIVPHKIGPVLLQCIQRL